MGTSVLHPQRFACSREQHSARSSRSRTNLIVTSKELRSWSTGHGVHADRVQVRWSHRCCRKHHAPPNIWSSPPLILFHHCVRAERGASVSCSRIRTPKLTHGVQSHCIVMTQSSSRYLTSGVEPHDPPGVRIHIWFQCSRVSISCQERRVAFAAGTATISQPTTWNSDI